MAIRWRGDGICQNLICPYCFTLQESKLPEPTQWKCISCGRVFPARDGVDLAEVGFGVSYFGWFYGIADEGEAERARKEGRPQRRAKLAEPVEFLQVLALWIVAGIVGNLAYDVIKSGAKNLYSEYQKRHKKPSDRTQVVAPPDATRKLPELHKRARTYLEAQPGGIIRYRRVITRIEGTYDFTRRVLEGSPAKKARALVRRGSRPRNPRRRPPF